MARLTARRRKALKPSQYGLPAKAKKGPRGGAPKGAYPMPDKPHAKDAKSRASAAERSGRITAGQERAIDRKANRMLGIQGDAARERSATRHAMAHPARQSRGKTRRWVGR